MHASRPPGSCHSILAGVIVALAWAASGAAQDGAAQDGSVQDAAPWHGDGIILLSCPTDGVADVPDPQALCDVLAAALRQVADTEQKVRLVAPGKEHPRRPGEIGVALRIGDQNTPAYLEELTGHLLWYPGPDADPVREASITMSVVDATLSAARYPLFVRSLISASPALVTVLKPPGIEPALSDHPPSKN